MDAPPLMQMVGNDYRDMHTMFHLEHCEDCTVKNMHDEKVKREAYHVEKFEGKIKKHVKQVTVATFSRWKIFEDDEVPHRVGIEEVFASEFPQLQNKDATMAKAETQMGFAKKKW